ncbi:MAG: IS5 family transposase [Candidatus Latescibacterota bacterium]|nr:IS5 family transposase [Candidatus Latescibacterota bacterium]
MTSKVSRSPKSVKPNPIYRVKNWSSYNRVLIARGSLTLRYDESVLSSWYYESPPQRGAQYTYSDQTIERALTLRCLLNFPLRQTQGFIHSILVLMGLDDMLVVPNYSTLSRRQAGLALAILVQPTKEPMYLVVDSAGLKTYGEGECKVRKHGWTTRRTWRELQLGIDAGTQEIVAHELTTAYADDARQLKGLLGQIDTQVACCYGDGAYDRWHVLNASSVPSYKRGKKPKSKSDVLYSIE